MKKVFPIYILIGIPVIILAVIIIKVFPQSATSDSPVNEFQEPPELGAGEPSANLPPYTGQAINIIGTNPIINQFPQEAVEQQRDFLAQLAQTLTENPIDYDGWIAVGIHKKFFHNYVGARDAWEYAKLIAPDQPKTYLNLGNLYAYYLRDLNKAEVNFLAATQRDISNFSGSYHATANFYRDFGFREKAIQYYQEILEIDPNDAAVRVEIERLGTQPLEP